MGVYCQPKFNQFLLNAFTPLHRVCKTEAVSSFPSITQPCGFEERCTQCHECVFSCLSSLFQKLCADKGLYTGCSAFKQSIWNNSKCYGLANNILISPRACSSWRSFNSKQKFTGLYHDNGLDSRDKMASCNIVRSALAGSESSGAAYPLSEFQLLSKIRGICFYTITAFIALFLFLLMLAAHPLVLTWDRYRRKAHHLVAKIWALLTIAPFFKVKFEGLENLPPPDTPAVYVSNHQSFLDTYALLTLGRSFKLISKTAIFLFPVIGWAMFLMGVIPLKRMDSRSQMDCLKRCIELIKNGASVFFFPEGTRSKDGKLGTFKKGAFSVAAKARVPIVPITLIGTGQIMPAGMEGVLRSGSVKVVIHKPIGGNDPSALCHETRKIIADTLICQG